MWHNVSCVELTKLFSVLVILVKGSLWLLDILSFELPSPLSKQTQPPVHTLSRQVTALSFSTQPTRAHGQLQCIWFVQYDHMLFPELPIPCKKEPQLELVFANISLNNHFCIYIGWGYVSLNIFSFVLI